MRPVATLLLGGLICWCGCGVGGYAHAGTEASAVSPAPPAAGVAAAPETAAGTTPPATDVAAGAGATTATPVAAGTTAPSILLAAGVFALVEAYDYPYSVGATYVMAPRWKWKVSPGTGFAVGPDGIGFFYVDIRRDFALGERWFVTPSLATGWFINGDVIGPRDHLEFQSGIQFSRTLENGWRVGLAGLHISNGGLHHPNNGTEAILVSLQVPLGKR